MTDDPDYSYELLTSKEDARACAELAAISFTQTNVITMAHGLTVEQNFEQICLPCINSVLDEHLSLFARHRATQEMVGCIIAGDFYLSRLHHEPYTGSFMLMDLCDELDDMFARDLGEELKPNMVLQISLTVTKQSEVGKGLATRLSQLVCEHARRARGFHYALVQVTHPATKHIYLEKLGGKIISEIDPATWVWKRGGNIMPYKKHSWEPIPNILLALGKLEK